MQYPRDNIAFKVRFRKTYRMKKNCEVKMKNGKTFFLPVAIVLLLVLTSVQIAFASPALATDDTVTLSIVNKTDETITVYLENKDATGEDYDITVNPTTTKKKNITEGEYVYEYEACGGAVQGSLDATDDVKLVIPVCKEKVKLTIVNNTSEKVVVYLENENSSSYDYEISVSKGDTKTKNIVEGEYEYEYYACGSTWDGNLTANKNVTLTINNCANMPTKMQINSHFSANVEVSLSGDKSYDFDVELGKNRVELLSGTYIFSWEACDTVFSEELRVLKNGTSEITIHSCEWYESPARVLGKPNPVKFIIRNTATFPVDIYLRGPYSYYLNIQPGSTRYVVATGDYEYGYYLDGEWNSGTFSVLPNGTTELILKPAHVFGVDSTEEPSE